MKYILIALILILMFLYPCKNYFISSSGVYYTSRDHKTAQVINVLRDISYLIVDDIPQEDAKVLKTSLDFTTFTELIGDKPTILAWNIDKGREISIRIYDHMDNPFSASHIIRALLHELAHTLEKSVGHGPSFNEKNEMLQKLRKKYVETLINNTFIQQ